MISKIYNNLTFLFLKMNTTLESTQAKDSTNVKVRRKNLHTFYLKISLVSYILDESLLMIKKELTIDSKTDMIVIQKIINWYKYITFEYFLLDNAEEVNIYFDLNLELLVISFKSFSTYTINEDNTDGFTNNSSNQIEKQNLLNESIKHTILEPDNDEKIPIIHNYENYYVKSFHLVNENFRDYIMFKEFQINNSSNDNPQKKQKKI